MFRLVYDYCRGWQRLCPAFAGHTPPFSTNTFYPLFAAVFLLLIPQLIKGQCYTMICNQNVELPLGNDCTGTINPKYIIQNNWSCQGSMKMKYYDAAGNYIGEVVTGAYIGQTLSVHVTHNATGQQCWGSVFVTDKKKPVVTTTNVTLNCTQDPSATALGGPTVTDNCASTVTVSHQDSVIDFACGYTGFAGYFAPGNWDIVLTNNGDGGVDVTGAPNSMLVEGADNSPLSLTPRYVTKLKIVIPAEGYVSFDWSSFGGSYFNIDAFYLTINEWCVQLSNDTTQSGFFTTPLLYPGDLLSFEQTSDGNADVVNTLISNFHFHTLALKVINRTWTATDAYGNSASKTQVITLTRTQLSQVVFPPDFDGIQAPLLGCSEAADLSVTGMPFIDLDGNPGTTSDQSFFENGTCFFSLSYQDQYATPCGGSGMVLRKWTVTDDCSSQILEHTQQIKFIDVTPPQIECPSSTMLNNSTFGCSDLINLPMATATDDCSPDVTITPVWDFGTGQGSYSGIPSGIYPVTYLAEDACGNVASCQISITVGDSQPPAANCLSGLTVNLGAGGQVNVPANTFNLGSSDNCTPASSLMFCFSTDPDDVIRTFTCDDLGGQIPVQLYVMDQIGNMGLCQSFLMVLDNQHNCSAAAEFVSVSGQVKKPNGAPIGQVAIHLFGLQTLPVTTGANGIFKFEDLLKGSDVTLTPSKNVFPNNGVTAYDLALINDHILGQNVFQHAWQVIAADANNSGTVTAADLVAIQSVILYTTPNFPNGTPSWRFVPADYIFPNPVTPFPFPQSISLQNVLADYTTAYFTGIKTGDVNGNADPAQLIADEGDLAAIGSGVGERNEDVFWVKTAKQQLLPGEPLEVTFEIPAAAAWQFTLEFDRSALQFLSVNNGLSEILPAFGFSHSDEGKITVLHFGDEPLHRFTLIFKGLKNVNLEEVLQVSSFYTPAYAWNIDGGKMDLKLEFTKEDTSNSPLLTVLFYQNQPNPFSVQTVIPFELSAFGQVKFTFFDVSGRVVKSVNMDAKFGYNELIVRQEELAVTGVVYYRAETEQEVKTGKMMVIK